MRPRTQRPRYDQPRQGPALPEWHAREMDCADLRRMVRLADSLAERGRHEEAEAVRASIRASL